MQIITVMVPAFLLLFGAYMGSYYAMLETKAIIGSAPGVIPIYRLHSPVVRAFYSPANELDRIVRPDYWDLGRTFLGT